MKSVGASVYKNFTRCDHERSYIGGLFGGCGISGENFKDVRADVRVKTTRDMLE